MDAFGALQSKGALSSPVTIQSFSHLLKKSEVFRGLTLLGSSILCAEYRVAGQRGGVRLAYISLTIHVNISTLNAFRPVICVSFQCLIYG